MRRLVFLIRHGRAEYKPGRLYGWTPGVHLSSDGVEDAKRLAVRLEPVRFRAVYSSPLERCRETAQAIAAAQRLDVNVVEGLGDVRYGLTLAGQKELANQMDAAIVFLTGGKGIFGIDSKKPLGMYVPVPANASDKISVLSVGPIIADAVRAIFEEESVSGIFGGDGSA